MARRIGRAAGAVAVMAIAAAIEACAAGEGVPDAPASARPTATASQPAPSSPLPRSPAGAVRACGNDDVSVTVTLQPGRSDGRSRALVAVTNRSGFPCRVEGHAAISLVDPADEVAEVPTRNVDQPGPSVPAVLRPGVAAFEGISWTPCDKGSDSCHVGNTLRFSLQSGTDGPVATLSGFPDPEANRITMASLLIGTLQPARQGVVAW